MARTYDPLKYDRVERKVRGMHAQLDGLPKGEATRADPHAYAGNPLGYCKDVLGITLLPELARVLTLLHVPPYRVLVPSGHGYGKTHGAAAALNYWYDSYNPGAVFTIGPRFDSLKDTVWGEVRRQRARAGLPDTFIGPSAPHMETATDHWAKAFTAARDSSLTGRHFPRMLFVVEEATGVDPIWWQVIMTMFDASLGHAQLCIFNPTDTTSAAYQQDILCDDPDGRPLWHRVRLDSTKHPNVLAELAGKPKVIAYAVSLDQINQAIVDDCEPVDDPDDRLATDIFWPPDSENGRWYRPGPVFQARWQGTWPDSGGGVWSPSLFEACCALPSDGVLGLRRMYPLTELPQIGVDCSMGKGEDYFGLHARWGVVSVHHETSNTMDPARILGRVKAVCAKMAGMVNAHRSANAAPVLAEMIPVKLDDDGTGGAVGAFLREEGYLAYQVNAAKLAIDESHYPRMRDELWFQVAKRASRGLVKLGMLDRKTLGRLRQQLLAPSWDLDGAGRKKVEPKDDTKEKIGRSPDDADALCLAHLEGVDWETAQVMPSVVDTRDRLQPTSRGGRFGR